MGQNGAKKEGYGAKEAKRTKKSKGGNGGENTKKGAHRRSLELREVRPGGQPREGSQGPVSQGAQWLSCPLPVAIFFVPFAEHKYVIIRPNGSQTSGKG